MRKNEVGMDYFDKQKYTITRAKKSIAESKNILLNHAKDNGYDYIFIIEDDIIIKDSSLFSKYIDLMDKYDIPVIFNPYTNPQNFVMKTRPNPCAIIRTSSNEEIDISRHVGSGIICFKVDKDMQLFDTELQSLEHEFYMWDLLQANKIPSFGFFLDIHDSFKYIEKSDDTRVRQRNITNSQHDIALRDTNFVLDLNIDNFLHFIREKNNFTTNTKEWSI
jgi:hypothetical protein